MKKLLIIVSVTASSFMLYAETVKTIQGIGTYSFDKTDCYRDSKGKEFCGYYLYLKSINWSRLRGNELQINVSLNCKGKQESIEKKVTRETGRLYGAVFICSSTDTEPSFVLRENLAEIAHHNPQITHGPKPGDWSKVLKKDDARIRINESIEEVGVGVWGPSYSGRGQDARRKDAQYAATLHAKTIILNKIRGCDKCAYSPATLNKMKGEVIRAVYDEDDYCEVVFRCYPNQVIELEQ